MNLRGISLKLKRPTIVWIIFCSAILLWNLESWFFQKDSFLLQLMEQKYKQRALKVHQMCNNLDDNQRKLSSLFRSPFFLYIPQINVAYCGIGKVGSTTWNSRFIYLWHRNQNPPEINYTPNPVWNKIFQAINLPGSPVPNPYAIGIDFTHLEEASEVLESSTSFVFVRNPFDRLASFYYNFVVKKNPELGWIPNDQATYNGRDPCKFHGNPINTYKSPEHFLTKHVLALYQKGKYDMHSHPLYQSCPVCLFNFTVIGKLEENYENQQYMQQRLRLPVLNPDAVLNRMSSPKSGPSKEVRFWQCISPGTVQRVYKMYRFDFEAFDYDVKEYFADLRLEDKLKDLL